MDAPVNVFLRFGLSHSERLNHLLERVGTAQAAFRIVGPRQQEGVARTPAHPHDGADCARVGAPFSVHSGSCSHTCKGEAHDELCASLARLPPLPSPPLPRLPTHVIAFIEPDSAAFAFPLLRCCNGERLVVAALVLGERLTCSTHSTDKSLRSLSTLLIAMQVFAVPLHAALSPIVAASPHCGLRSL